MKKFVTARIIVLAASTAMLIGGGVTTAAPSVAAGCQGRVLPARTVGGQASVFQALEEVDGWNFTSGAVIAYWPGTWGAYRSPCYTGTQRISVVHQTYKWDPRYNQWVKWQGYRQTATVGPGRYAPNLSFGAYDAPLDLHARATVSWYTYGGRFLAKRTYPMWSSGYYSCINPNTCVVKNGYIHFLHGNGGF